MLHKCSIWKRLLEIGVKTKRASREERDGIRYCCFTLWGEKLKQTYWRSSVGPFRAPDPHHVSWFVLRALLKKPKTYSPNSVVWHSRQKDFLKAASHYNDKTSNADADTKSWRVGRAVQLHRCDRPTDSSPTTNVCRSSALSVGRSAFYSNWKIVRTERLPRQRDHFSHLSIPLFKSHITIVFITSCK